MAQIRLTDRTLRALSTDRPREDFFDERLDDFGVRVSGETGSKTFFVRYRANGKRRRLTLGRYPILGLADAREKAKAVLFDVIQGSDPAAELQARRLAETFGELADLYLERHARPNKARKSYREDQRQIERDLRPAWGDRKASEVKRSDVQGLLDRIVDRGAPIMANRTRALVSRIFTFGIDRGIVQANPAYRVKPPSKERSRERVLNDSEINKVWKALEKEPLVTAASFRLRLLTAQRGIEVHSMRHADIDGIWWTIPAEISKTEDSHRVPLAPQALAVLAELKPLSKRSEWILPARRGSGHLEYVHKATARIRDECGFHFTPHDLRRTAATGMARLGISRFVIGRVLNHADRSVTAIYDRASYDEAKREALEAWGAWIARIVTEVGS